MFRGTIRNPADRKSRVPLIRHQRTRVPPPPGNREKMALMVPEPFP
jgi:hypothetical protein